MPPSALLTSERPSPELVLVDAQLAVAARSTLPEVDTLAEIELLVRAHRISASRSLARAQPLAVAQAPARAPVLVLAPASPPARVHGRAPASGLAGAPVHGRGLVDHRWLAFAAGSLTIAALVAALLAGLRLDVGGKQAGTDASLSVRPPVAQAKPTPAQRKPAVESPDTKPKTRSHRALPLARSHQAVESRRPKAKVRPHRVSPRAPSQPSIAAPPRRFVWAPVSDATAYRVQFFRGSKLVFDATTKKPEVTVPQRWTLGGSRQSLAPGTYRWNVWPITAAGQDSRAAVQARLVVSR